NTQELEELCLELGYDSGEVFRSTTNLSGMAQDLQGYAKRRGQEQQLLAAVAALRPHLDLTPYGYAGGAGSSSTASSQTGQPAATTGTVVATPPGNPMVYISYAWGGEREEFVNKLDDAFKGKGITIIRDKRNLGYHGRIREFMQQIGRGKAVIAVISKKYLESPNCMFELTEIAKNTDFADRVFPVILPDAEIYDPVKRLGYVKYWENKIAEFDAAMKEVSAMNLDGFREEIDTYGAIRAQLPRLTYILKDMNTLSPDMHEESGFAELFAAVEKKLAE
ncbi:MAG TPA: TIR domain-containing protein, partial [Chloroflexota bacterium]|nr:TIR domain-containing protein [Chloroflexota bacterium]